MKQKKLSIPSVFVRKADKNMDRCAIFTIQTMEQMDECGITARWTAIGRQNSGILRNIQDFLSFLRVAFFRTVRNGVWSDLEKSIEEWKQTKMRDGIIPPGGKCEKQ